MFTRHEAFEVSHPSRNAGWMGHGWYVYTQFENALARSDSRGPGRAVSAAFEGSFAGRIGEISRKRPTVFRNVLLILIELSTGKRFPYGEKAFFHDFELLRRTFPTFERRRKVRQPGESSSCAPYHHDLIMRQKVEISAKLSC